MVHTPHVTLQVEVPNWLQETVAELVAFLPRLVGAVVILLIGWIVGVFAARLVSRVTDEVQLDRMVLDTPLGRIMGGSRQAVTHTFGTAAKWFVYAVAILAAANVLAIQALSEWIATAVSYLPAFIAGLAVIVLGFVVADFIGDAIMRTQAATETAYTSWFATGTRMFLYFTAVVIGLDTMGVDTNILYVFANAAAWGLAAAVALGAGIAFGWGGRDYVRENIDRWMGRVSAGTPSPTGAPTADGGTRRDPQPDGGTDADELAASDADDEGESATED